MKIWSELGMVRVVLPSESIPVGREGTCRYPKTDGLLHLLKISGIIPLADGDDEEEFSF